MGKHDPLKEIGQTVRQGIDPQATQTARPVLSTIRVFSGWATASTLVLGTARAVSESFDRTAALVRQLRARPPAREETFGEAVARLKLTNKDIDKQLDQFRGMAANWFIAFSIALIFLAWTPVASRPVSQFILSLGVALWTASRALHWHFRSCQVRDRELYSFGPWFRSDVWVRRVSWVSGALITVLLLLLSTMAHAQGAPTPVNWGMFSPDSGDPTVGFLREVFGSVIDQIHGGSDIKSGKPEGVLGNMLVPFNGAVLFLGMIFIVYTTIKGTVDSAHDGEILGRKMSSIWVPMRTLGGTAILLPLGSGYSLVQVAILWLALQAIGIANAVLSIGVDQIHESQMVSNPRIPDARPLAAAILKNEVCRAAMNTHWSQVAAAGGDTPPRVELREAQRTFRKSGSFVSEVARAPVVTPIAFGSDYYTVTNFKWSETTGAFMDGEAVCGAIEWKDSTEKGNDKIVHGPIMAAHAAATREMIASLAKVADEIVAGKKPAPGALDAAAQKYEQRLVAAAKEAVNATEDRGRTDFLQFVKEGGWIQLPTYYNSLIYLNDSMQSALNSLPTSSAAAIKSKELAESLISYQDAMTVANELISHPNEGTLAQANEYLSDRAGAAERAYALAVDKSMKVPTSWEDVEHLISRPAQAAVSALTSTLAGSNLSHIGQIKSVGDTIITTGWVIAGTQALASGLAGSKALEWSVGIGFSPGEALKAMGGIVTTLIVMLLFFGAWAAFYIPMIPYIMGITAIIKWFVLVFESVIAAPIFAVAHIHPDGDDTVGRAGPGYMLILGNIMRPTLVVFGFFGSIWLAQPITSLINQTYATAMNAAEYNSVTGLTGFVAYTGIYVMLMTGVVHSIFSLVNWLPDNVLRWIGGSLGAHGMADVAADRAENDFKAGFVQVRQGVGGLAPTKPAPGAGTAAGKTGKTNDQRNAELLG